MYVFQVSKIMEAATLARSKSTDAEEALVSPKVAFFDGAELLPLPLPLPLPSVVMSHGSLPLIASQFAIVVLFLASAVIALWLLSTRRRRLFKGGDVAHLFEAVEVSMAVAANHLSVSNIIILSPKASPTQRHSTPAGQLHETRLTRPDCTHASACLCRGVCHWPCCSRGRRVR
jgi:hypothetical protein